MWPKAAGFEEVPQLRYFYVPDRSSAKRYNRHALDLVENGAQVVTVCERLAIGGLQGYVTMLARRQRLRGQLLMA
jgi:hypothetical protein